MPFADTEAMTAHLLEIARTISPGAHAVLVVDGAGWHISDKLKVPDTISLVTLPAYAPELNPVENIWEYLRKNKLSNRIYETYNKIVEACCEAWNTVTATPALITSITARDWAKVS